jgi:PKD repeat protein
MKKTGILVLFFAIQFLFVQGQVARRAVTERAISSDAAAQLKNEAKAPLDAKMDAINVPVASYCAEQSITPSVVIRNAGTTTLTSCVVRYQIDGGVTVTQSWSGNLFYNATATVTFLPVVVTNGSHSFKAWTSSPNGGADQVTSNDTLTKAFNVSNGASLPFLQAFESTTFPPSDWTVVNSDGGITWARRAATGNGASTAAAYMNFYNYNSTGQLDELITEPIDLTTVTDAEMTFNVAYRRYDNTTDDGLKIFVSTDCGATFSSTPVYNKSGTVLATTTNSTSAFTPSLASQWRNDTVDLGAFVGNSIVLKFQSLNDYGNNLYIDDINIYSTSQPPVAAFSADPTVNCTGVVTFTDLSAGNPSAWLWNFGDGTTSTDQSPVHAYQLNGTYTVSLTVTNANGSDMMTQSNLITVTLPQAPSGMASSRCGPGTVTLSASGSGTLAWFADQIGGTQLGTGTSFTTPSISSTTTYYVESQVPSASEYVGKSDNSGTGANYNSSTAHGIIFNALVPFRLVSVKVYAQSAGNRTITLTTSGGTVLQQITVNIPSGESRVTLNFDVPVGTGLKLMGPGYPNLFRNSASVSYPYTLAGVVSLTTSTAGTTPLNYYYFFYDWEIQESQCVSARVPVVATVKPLAEGGVAYGDPSTVCSGGTTILRDSLFVGTSFQWQNSPNGTSGWANITGATGSTYVTPPITSPYYARLIVTNSCSVDTSSVLTISLSTGAVAGVASAAPTTVCTGNSTTLSLSGYSGNIQWQYSIDGTNFVNINNGINPTYTTPPLTQNVFGRAVVSIPNCGSETSNVVAITVNPGPEGGNATAASSSICTGTNTTLTLDSYFGSIQWQISTNGTSWSNVGGATSASYTTANLTADRFYRAILSVAGCGTDTSNSVHIVVNSAPVGGTATAAPSSICSGNYTTITLTGYNGTIQWQGSPTGTGWTNINGATSDIYVTPVLTSDYYYRAVVLSAGCGSVFSTSVQVTVAASPVAGIAEANYTTVCTGTGAVLTLSGYTGSIQWQGSPDGVSWTNIGGATNATYSTPSLTATRYYRAVVSTTGCTSEYSNELQITVSAAAAGGFANAASGVVCSGSTTNITLTGYSGNIQWQQSPDGSSWTDIPGATYEICNTGPVYTEMYYQAVVTLPGCGSATSTFAYVNVTPAAVGGTATASASSVCQNSNVTLTVTGSTGTIQWEYSPDQVNWMDIPGATAASFTGSIPQSLYFRAVLSYGSCPDVSSNEVYVDVSPLPDASFSYVANGLSVAFTSTSSNATSYHWAFGDGGISTQASPTYNYTASGTYNVVMIATNSCGSDTALLTLYVVYTSLSDAPESVLKVYPNPSDSWITVESETFIPERIEISDITGRKVLIKKVTGNPVLVDMTPCQPGVYVIEIFSGDQRRLTKVIKN